MVRSQVVDCHLSLMDVVIKQGGGDHMAAQFARVEGRREQDQRRRSDQHQSGDGKNAPDAARDEVLEIDAAGAVVFVEQQLGNQVTRDNEEDVDADEAAGNEGGKGVIKHHG